MELPLPVKAVDLSLSTIAPYRRVDLEDRLRQTRARLLDGRIRVLVVGEFKQGKSMLVNALSSAPICPVYDDVATGVPTVVQYAAEPTLTVVRHVEGPDGRPVEERAVRTDVPITELADAVGVRQPTMTHHLDTLERAGLVRRERDPADRRVQRVSSTPAGDAASPRLRATATAVDRRLPAGFSAAEVDQLRELLTRLADNAGGGPADRDRPDPPAGAMG